MLVLETRSARTSFVSTDLGLRLLGLGSQRCEVDSPFAGFEFNLPCAEAGVPLIEPCLDSRSFRALSADVPLCVDVTSFSGRLASCRSSIGARTKGRYVVDESKGRTRLVATSATGVAAMAALVWGIVVAVRRFRERQFSEGEVKPTGWLASAIARTAPWLGEWMYSGFANRLDLAPDDLVLDVACGSGAFLRKHASHVRRISGLDHSDDLIAFAQRDNHERIAAGTAEFVVGDATVLPWDDNEFTVVTCNSIDCFATKTRPALEEMYRVLRPGGRILVGDDHGKDMEEIGFTEVTVEHLLWGSLTSATKQAA